MAEWGVRIGYKREDDRSSIARIRVRFYASDVVDVEGFAQLEVPLRGNRAIGDLKAGGTATRCGAKGVRNRGDERA